MHDLFNFVKLTPNMIFTLEHAELCYMITTLPGFVPYPRDKLMPDSDTGRVRLSRTTTKKDTSPAVTKDKLQNGHLKSSGTHLAVPSVIVSTEKQFKGNQSGKEMGQQTNTLSNNVSVSITEIVLPTGIV